MIFIKWTILVLIFFVSCLIGKILANRYKGRVEELKEMECALNILKTKMQYTYQPLPEIFKEIANNFQSNIGSIFKTASKEMKNYSASEAWKNAIQSSKSNFSNSDLKVIENLEKLLGKTNLEGQLSEIEVTQKFLDNQIKEAEDERIKNEKLFKSLSIITGLAIVIILI